MKDDKLRVFHRNKSGTCTEFRLNLLKMDAVKLHSGSLMPLVGLGTWKVSPIQVFHINLYILLYPMADPGFPRARGRQPLRGGDQHTTLTNFSRKLHENEEILGRGGEAHVPRIPSRSATGIFFVFAYFYLKQKF